MLSKISSILWPNLTPKEMRKYGILAATFFFIVGSYWLLKTLKDGFFFNVVGGTYQPQAKMFSLIFISIVVIIYSKLIDTFRRHRLFYIIGTFYLTAFSIITLIITFSSTNPSMINTTVLKSTAWASYFLIESFGSIMIALFWSFVASISSANSAKRGYSMIVASGQLGAVLGPFLSWHANTIGMPLLFGIATSCIVIIMLIIKYFIQITPRRELVISDRKESRKTQPGFWSGLKLLITKPYLLGILGIVAIYEIVTTIIDYQMKMQALALPKYSTTESLTSFMGMFGMTTNSLALLMALFGTGYFISKLGLRKSLLIFPSCLGIAIAILCIFVSFCGISGTATLWLTFGIVVIAKGLSYSLNNPAKEILYIPTSKDAKFKTKGWIDMFGSRGAKAAGSTFTNYLKHSPTMLLYFGTLLSMGLIGIWIFIAIFVGQKFHKLTKENTIIS